MLQAKINLHLMVLFQHVPLFQSTVKARSSDFCLIDSRSLTKLFGSFWFKVWNYGYGFSSSVVTMLVVVFFVFKKNHLILRSCCHFLG